MLAIIGLRKAQTLSRNEIFAKDAAWCFRATPLKNQCKCGLEDEGGGRGKSRKQGRGGIEDRPSAHVPGNASVEDCLPRGGADLHGHEPAALLELTGEPIRHDLGCPIDED